MRILIVTMTTLATTGALASTFADDAVGVGPRVSDLEVFEDGVTFVAAGSVTRRTICQLVQPMPSAASRKEFGTARSASWEAVMTIGRMTSVSVKAPAMTERPNIAANAVMPRIP